MAITEIPSPQITDEDRLLAQTTLEAILRSGEFRLEADGKTFAIPKSAAKQIVSVLNFTAAGQCPDVIPASSQWTVCEAADFLNVPEGCVEELLDNGVLKFHQDEKQRLVLRDSLLDYDRRLKKGEAAMNEIIQLSQEMGLYDD